MAGKSNRVLSTAKEVRDAVAINGKQTEYRIEGARGLVLLVTADGVGTFYLRYTLSRGKKRLWRSIKLKRRDETSLAEIIKEADQQRAAVGKGDDPVARKQAARRGTTFKALFEDREKKDDERAKATLENYRVALNAKYGGKSIMDELGDMPADQITADEIADILERIEASSKSAAHKARSALGSTFRWGLKRRKVRNNPVAGLGFTHRSKPRERRWEAHELASLWNGIATEQGLSGQMRTLLKLCVLTGQRRANVAGAFVSELNLEQANPTWRIGASRMKSKKNGEQVVPLSKQAAALFREAIEGSLDGYVFPALSGGSETRTPFINPESVSRAMARLCKRIDLEDAHTHDLRKAIATWLREEKLAPDFVLDKILHHKRAGTTDTSYNFATLLGPVRDAMQAWADHVEAVASSAAAPTNNVRTLVRA